MSEKITQAELDIDLESCFNDRRIVALEILKGYVQLNEQIIDGFDIDKDTVYMIGNIYAPRNVMPFKQLLERFNMIGEDGYSVEIEDEEKTLKEINAMINKLKAQYIDAMY